MNPVHLASRPWENSFVRPKQALSCTFHRTRPWRRSGCMTPTRALEEGWRSKTSNSEASWSAHILQSSPSDDLSFDMAMEHPLQEAGSGTSWLPGCRILSASLTCLLLPAAADAHFLAFGCTPQLVAASVLCWPLSPGSGWEMAADAAGIQIHSWCWTVVSALHWCGTPSGAPCTESAPHQTWA